jgi:ABC-type transport system involved in multi-copper enzyme maturation permease subunit
MPVFRCALVGIARKCAVLTMRAMFAGILLAVIVATLGAWYYWENGRISPGVMARVARQSLAWIVMAHAVLIMGVAGDGALAIAGEKDRRTLDFLLATRLGNAEIILGKLAACLTALVMILAAGFPVVLLLHVLGGMDLRVIGLAYAGTASTAFFVLAVSILVSTGATDARRATGAAMFVVVAWIMLPVLVSIIFPRVGVRLPGFLRTANAWVAASTPPGLLFRFVPGGLRMSRTFVVALAEMSGLQLAGGALLVLASIVRLRAAYRASTGGDGLLGIRKRARPAWRLRPRPPVGDDPILWREMYTSQTTLVLKLVGFLICLGLYLALGYGTFFFGWRAASELWRQGYAATTTSSERPEFNWVIRFYFSETSAGAPVDLARTDFNLFLRGITAPIVFLLGIMAAAVAAELIATERAKSTWDSLIATPLSGFEILRSKLLAALWRLRWLPITLVCLWTFGMATGAVHPLGYLLTVLELAAWIWFCMTLGLLAALRSRDPATAGNVMLNLLGLPLVSVALPYLLPARLSSVLWGAGSWPFVTWLSLLSYRDVRAAVVYPVYPHLQWINLHTGEGPLPVIATCLIAMIAPLFGGLWTWRYLTRHFDRIIGRPSAGVRCPPSMARCQLSVV